MVRHPLSRSARAALIAFGLVEIVAPQPVIDACERIGLENPGDGRLRSEALTLARLEGALFVWELRRGRRRTPMTSGALTSAGLLAVLAPRPLIRFSQSFAYENPHELKLKSWVVPATRALGVLYLAVVALAAQRDTEADERDAQADTLVERVTQ
ncbi:hypothetical protein Halru_0024 [Halovivax ruber XH-70]|uniref:Uncharacterized protein n=1 Tax=Halovivax ruber (strain DSM 18193 / JCM 13892 / XH-70) TaxID=797302 RepID=L0I7B5_HALRX|nr:hypothetical protein [Halovivax ruber]AGB14678.1 hypothetical protein Halru_0024 [Halovivax ruber XH-70]